jgi:hypothetical protein
MINGMAESKLQKRAYRKALREHQGDRLSDLVAASHFGSDVCLACTLVRPASAISDGVCSVCRQGLSRFLVRRLVATSEPLVPTQPDPLAIYVDASWQDGVAGLAIVGALGSHSKRMPAQSSGHAEVHVMLWALRIAKHSRDERPLVFRTDNQSAQRAGTRGIPNWAEWVVEWVPRRRNHAADRLALQARVAA